MTFIIALYVREGIVLASDSRLTLNKTNPQGQNTIIQIAVGQTDTVNKTFLTHNKIGISTYGHAEIDGIPISGYIESFVKTHLADNNFDVETTANELLTHFAAYPNSPNTNFLVAGYQIENDVLEQHIWEVKIQANQCTRINQTGVPGASWRGITDVISRLVIPVFEKKNTNRYVPFPPNPIHWNYFTLQDAIDYAKYAVQTTIDTLKFSARAKTVGGPVDILILKPNEALWIKKKELFA